MLSAMPIAGGRPVRGARAHPRPVAGLQGKSSLASPAPGVAFARTTTGYGRTPGGRGSSWCPAPGWPTGGWRRAGWARAPRTPLLPWAAAPRAASSSAASSARSGGRAQRRRGRCIPPLAAAAAPRPRAEHPRALPGIPATSSRMLSPQDVGGVSKVLCPSNLLPRLRPAASGPRQRGAFPALVSAGRSVPDCPCGTSGGRVTPARTRNSKPCARGLWSGAPSGAAAAAPAPRAPSLALSLPQLVTFHQLSSRSPNQWQTRAQAGGPAPSAAASQHPHPMTSPKVVAPAGRTPTSPPPPRLNLRWDPSPAGPRGLLTEGETEAQERLVLGCKPVRG